MWKSFGLGPGRTTMGDASRPARREGDDVFRVAVFADFSGRASRGLCEPDRIGKLRPIAVDRDDFEAVLEKLNPTVSLPLAEADGPRIELSFKELDDFHPDRIFEQVDLFDALRSTRDKLTNPRTFAEAAKTVRGWAYANAAAEQVRAEQAAPATPPAANALGDGSDILAAMLSAPAPSPVVKQVSSFEALLQKVVGPHVDHTNEAEQSALVSAVDEATGAEMRRLLHDPHFQTLEAAWRSLFFLCRRLPTGVDLKIAIYDVTRDEVAADLARDDFKQSDLYTILVEQTVGTPGGKPWTLIVGDYRFAPTAADAALVSQLGLIAEAAGAPFLAGAADEFVGCASVAATPHPDDWKELDDAEALQAWGDLRSRQHARYVGLAFPRFLLRLPYGRDLAETERFEFEEVPADAELRQPYLLWGNGAHLAAYLIGIGYAQDGWKSEPGNYVDVPELPAYAYDDRGDSTLMPCGEALIIDEGVERIAASGLIPVLTISGRDAVRVAPIQSIAAPAGTPLSGRWG